MHEEVITTTSTTSKFSSNSIVNSNSLHQSNDDGTITVSIIHPHQHSGIGDFIATTNFNAPCSNQIVPSQTKLILSTNELHTLKDDVSVIINGSISNSNDPNVLILPATETCDSDKNSLSLSQLTTSHAEQVETDLHDVTSEASSREEGESSVARSFFLSFSYLGNCQLMLPLLLLMYCKKAKTSHELIAYTANTSQTKGKRKNRRKRYKKKPRPNRMSIP